MLGGGGLCLLQRPARDMARRGHGWLWVAGHGGMTVAVRLGRAAPSSDAGGATLLMEKEEKKVAAVDGEMDKRTTARVQGRAWLGFKGEPSTIGWWRSLASMLRTRDAHH